MIASTKCASYRPCMLLALQLSLFSASMWSQTQLATVFGTINDPSGAVIPGAQVTIVNRNTGLKLAILTDTTGQYHLPACQQETIPSAPRKTDSKLKFVRELRLLRLPRS